MSTHDEVNITKTIAAPRQAVFEAWLDPEKLSKFMTPAPGMTVPRAETDAKVGGKYLIVMKAGEQEIPHHGEYKQIDRYEKLVFTWLSPFSQPGSLVTLTFKELAPNQTELNLHHVGFKDEESRNNHEGGWTSIVEVLSKVVA